MSFLSSDYDNMTKLQRIRHELQKLRTKDPKYRPPTLKSVADAQLLSERDRKIWAIVLECIGYVIFLWLLFLIAYGQRTPQSFYLHQSLKRVFFEHKSYRLVSNFHFRSHLVRNVFPNNSR